MSALDRLRARLLQRPILDLAPDLLTLQGGFSYRGGWNPLVACLTKGVDQLSGFYSLFQPKDVAEFYFLDRYGGGEEQFPPWTLPWLTRAQHKPPSAEGGLSPTEHGVSYYGPCSAEKIAFEHRRLTTLRANIEKHGYQPEKYGHIQGCLMLRNASVRFFVRGGKHRAAVLSALGYERIPVSFRRNWPSAIDRAMASKWPLVAEGRMSLDLACQIFDRYFDSSGIEQAAMLKIAR